MRLIFKFTDNKSPPPSQHPLSLTLNPIPYSFLLVCTTYQMFIVLISWGKILLEGKSQYTDQIKPPIQVNYWYKEIIYKDFSPQT